MARTKDKWGDLHGFDGEPAGELEVPITCDRKTRRKFTEKPVTDAVIKQVEEMAVKDGAVKGINFKDQKGVEYEFDNTKYWLSQMSRHLSRTSRQMHQVC